MTTHDQAALRLRNATETLLLFENDDSQHDLARDAQLREQRARAVDACRTALEFFDLARNVR